MDAEKYGEGLLDNLESCINKTVLGVREKLNHFVSGKNLCGRNPLGSGPLLV